MKRLLTLVLVITSLFLLSGVASAEQGNIGGIGFTKMSSSNKISF